MPAGADGGVQHVPLWKAGLRRIRSVYHDLRIGGKLMLMYFVAFLIPFFFVAVFGYSLLERELGQGADRELQNDVYTTVQSVENRLDAYSVLATAILLDSRLQTYVRQEYSGIDYLVAYRYIQERFTSVLSLNPGVASISIYVSNPSLPSDHVLVKRIDSDAASLPWYPGLRKTDGATPLYLPTSLLSGRLQNSGQIQQYFGFSILKQKAFQIGARDDTIIRLDVRETEIGALLKQYDSNRSLFVLDEDGTILFATDEAQLLKPLSSLIRFEGSSESSIPADGKEYGYRGQDRVIAHFLTLRNGWRVVGIMPYADLMTKARTTLLGLLVVYGVFLLIAVGLLYATSRYWTRRFRTMTRMMKQLEQGDFDVDVGMTGKDEFDGMLNSFAGMSRKISTLIEEVYVKEISRKQAELNNLQYLINPHFLYNTLSSISALARKNHDQDVNDMVHRLAKFYRLSLSKGDPIVPVRVEVELTRLYMEIQKVRFGSRIQVTYDLDESLLDYRTLKVILLPFLENSINHGRSDEASTLSITVRLTREDDCIVFRVIDDGVGFDTSRAVALPDPMEPKEAVAGSGYGIANVDTRIRLAFGEAYGVSIESRSGEGTVVTLRIPL